MVSGSAISPLPALTKGLARGDDAAWEKFHQEYGREIFRQLVALARGDYDLANEALQQTYLRIARHARACDSAPTFAGWLRVVARTAISDCRRRRRTCWQLLQRYREEMPACSVTSEEEEKLQDALEKALGALDADDRALLEAKYYAELHVREIAHNLSLSTKAVESRLTRARATLRKQLLTVLSSS
jgi:RNA polymerase sigma-70 factor (ECF subfamily)